MEDGYEFFAKRQLVTLFSAPNYCGEFDNAGGMMSVDETLMCSFQVRSSQSAGSCLRKLFETIAISDPQAVGEEGEVPVRGTEQRQAGAAVAAAKRSERGSEEEVKATPVHASQISHQVVRFSQYSKL